MPTVSTATTDMAYTETTKREIPSSRKTPSSRVGYKQAPSADRRSPRQKVFRITINGLEEWTEDSDGRNMIEVQHKLALLNPGSHVRVREQWLTGTRPRPVFEGDGED